MKKDYMGNKIFLKIFLSIEIKIPVRLTNTKFHGEYTSIIYQQ